MTLRDMLDAGINFEGWIKIQTWDDMDNPDIHYEGYGVEKKQLEDYLDREVIYIFPYNTSPNEAAICIELTKE